MAQDDATNDAVDIEFDALDLREARAYVRKLELEGEELEFEIAERKARKTAAQAEASAHNIYTFYDPVNNESVKRCMAELGKWSRRSPKCEITVILNSPGGYVIQGLALFDYLRHLSAIGHKITTIALGQAASMGGVLLQAGDVRIMGENALLLIHEVSSGTWGKVSEMQDDLQFSQLLQNKLVRILCKRSTMSEKQLRARWKKKDWWLEADRAVELGFADKVQ